MKVNKLQNTSLYPSLRYEEPVQSQFPKALTKRWD